MRRWGVAIALGVMLAVLVVAAPLVPRASSAQELVGLEVPITIVAVNDFHGHLYAPAAASRFPDTGGAPYLASHLEQLRDEHDNVLFVDAGDLTGATVGLSNRFDDEPTVEAMNLMGLDLQAAGNHEFDDGLAPLLRQREGGCWQDDCSYRDETAYEGATFTTLAANVFERDTDERVFPAWTTRDVSLLDVLGLELVTVRVGFVGVVTEGSMTETALQDIDVRDRAAAMREGIEDVRAAGADVVVAIRHEGAHLDSEDVNACPDGVAEALPLYADQADVIIEGHTHQAYTCDADPGPVLSQAYRYGQVFTEITLQVDALTREVVQDEATNRLVTHDVEPHPEVLALLESWESRRDQPPPPDDEPTTSDPDTDPSETETPTPEPDPSASDTEGAEEEADDGIEVRRLAGPDRIATAAEVAETFPEADTVVLARADDFADALVAGPLAAQHGAPLLLTVRDGLAGQARAQLERLRPSRVVLVGGTAALDDQVADDVAALPWLSSDDVDRIAGSDRYDTAARIAARVVPDAHREVFLTTGLDFPDALAGAALAAARQAPVLLTDPHTLPPATREALSSTDPEELLVLGGAIAVSDAVADEASAVARLRATRIAGGDRYATAAAVADRFIGFSTAVLATGQDFPDALAGVAAAARASAPVLLVRRDEIPSSTSEQLDRLRDSGPGGQVLVVGGHQAVSDDVVDQLDPS